ncbi:hypothetical protein HF086_015950 [Spodoptera exigua]|uniref:Uncharacterized protein n=1 Tax=Spodoptera exigua TaxID=7107 RepID=A0A922M1K9_SPOEX|nr:hypothetical protein HF086_015950 [Spodoptera exigua]
MCQGKSESKSAKESKGQYFLNDSDSDDDCNFFKLVTSNDGDGPYYANLIVEKVLCKFEIDTGSKISAISKHFYDNHFKHVPIQTKLLCLRSYTGDVIETLGYIVVHVVCGSKTAMLKLFIIENGGPPLMGRTWIKHLKLGIFECHNIIDSDSVAKALREEFPDVVAEGLGTFRSPVSLHLKDETPVFVKARPLPLALRPRVESELKRLEKEGVIYKVERSEYGTPIVPRQEASERRRDTTLRVAEPQETVLLRDYSKNGQKWTEGTVVRRESPVSYTVKSQDGRVHKRHIDQILTNKHPKSRFSLSKVQEEACNQPVAEPILAPDTDQDDQGVEEWQLAEESPTSRTLSDRCDEAPSTPTNRAYRRAALRCMEKLRQM